MGKALIRVLVIDDDVDTASVTSEMLALSGFSACSAHSGEQGIAEARRFFPDVVLIDLGMPEMDGYEVANRLRDSEVSRDAVLIAYTGYNCRTIECDARKHGFDCVLQKPASVKNLVELITDQTSPSSASATKSARCRQGTGQDGWR